MELNDCPPFRASYGLEVPKKLLKTCSGPLTGSKLYPAQPVPGAEQGEMKHKLSQPAS